METTQTMESLDVPAILVDPMFDALTFSDFDDRQGDMARKMVLRADEFDIPLRIWSTRKGRQIIGQVHSRTREHFIPSARVHLLQDGERILTTGLNDRGEFQFDKVPDGFLALQIDLPKVTVIGILGLAKAG